MMALYVCVALGGTRSSPLKMKMDFPRITGRGHKNARQRLREHPIYDLGASITFGFGDLLVHVLAVAVAL